MAIIRITKKKATAREAPVTEFLTPVMPFLTIPFETMRGVAEGVDHAFGFTAGAEAGRWAPPVDVERRNGRLTVSVEMPGLKKEQVKVQYKEQGLFISGVNKRPHAPDDKAPARYERHFGEFYRYIPLPEDAETDHMKAELHDGILTVSMPAPEKKTIAA